MQKIVVLLVGLVSSLIFVIPTMAQPPYQPPCHLTTQTNCNLAQNQNRTVLQTYPADGEGGVPSYAWISVAFVEDVAFDTITSDTFTVTGGGALLSGEVMYIESSHMVIFKPNIPLRPETTYTARLLVEGDDLSGNWQVSPLIWSFTTAPERSDLNDLTLTNTSSAATSMQVYIGDLHAHSGYSGGQGTPVEAFTSARASGLDFFALTEHAYLLTEMEWQDVLTQAEAATVAGAFVGLRGFEYVHPSGHLNVFASDSYVQFTDPNYDTLSEFYAW